MSKTSPPPDATGEPQDIIRHFVEQAQAGDKTAFEEIYEMLSGDIFRFVYRRTNNRELAEDITSETFLQGFSKLQDANWEISNFTAWLFAIARNLVASYFSSGRYKREITTDNPPDASKTANSPEQIVVSYFSSIDLLKVVKQLNPEQQECIVLRFILGYTVSETAVAMNRTADAIRALQYRAVRSLAKLLPDDFET